MRARACLFGILGCLLAYGCGGGAEVSTSTTGGQGGAITGAGGSGGNGITTHPTTSSSSSASSGGSGGAAPTCPPTPPVEGPPLTAPPGKWTWIDVAGTKCRDGSPTGVGVRLNPASDKVLIYLEGGGACFNAETCLISLANFGKLAFDGWAATVGQTGIFNDGNPENPVKGWNAVYVPYCSGDVHAGSKTGVSVPGGPSHQTFVGYDNIGHDLGRIVPTFKSASQVLLTGVSAGGFGAAFNYDRVAAAFCPTPVVLLDDSGPPMSDDYLAPCLQQKWRALWNLDGTLPADCPACSEPDGGGIVNYVPYLASRWPESYLGLISSTHDAVISAFYGFGSASCTTTAPIPPDVYAAGLADLRAHYLPSSGRWGSYYVDSTQHTWLLGPGFYLTEVGGVKLTQWIRDLLHGYAAEVGP